MAKPMAASNNILTLAMLAALCAPAAARADEAGKAPASRPATGGVAVSDAAGTGEFEWKGGKWVRKAAAPVGSLSAGITEIRDLLAKKKWGDALSKAQKFVKSNPFDDDCEEAMFLAGEAEVGREHYFQGFEWYEKQIAKFPGGKFFQRALDREYAVAEAFLTGKKRLSMGMFWLPAKEDGLEILSKIVKHSPGSALARKSVMRIGDYHYRAGEWTEAVDAYDSYIELFKNDPDVEYAMLQGARATQSQFGGIEFDDTPLLEAQQRYKTFTERYPKAAKREGVPDTLRQITELRAQKLFSSAEFYRRTSRLDAAAYYYGQVATRFPETTWAANARQALGLLGGVTPRSPGEPSQSTVVASPPEGRYHKRFVPPPPPSEEGMLPKTSGEIPTGKPQ
ncbi:MAG: outer membrane protein assembly factor BamD [Planctomycetaceae bacterium]|nr:outer membrane protein assembly factor BamD [Planctomycetaceae bacterium]